jgi:mannose-6-phosphate isomerase-like protein (cupin superfamily)
MSDVEPFPDFVRLLPEAPLDFEGLRGWRLSGDEGVVMFMAASDDVVVPTHHHDAQWGIVIKGEMELTIGNATRTYRAGDTHFIPAGLNHSAHIHAGWRGVYVFARRDS